MKNILTFLAPVVVPLIALLVLAFIQPDDAFLPVNIGAEGWLLVLFGLVVGVVIEGIWVVILVWRKQ